MAAILLSQNTTYKVVWRRLNTLTGEVSAEQNLSEPSAEIRLLLPTGQDAELRDLGDIVLTVEIPNGNLPEMTPAQLVGWLRDALSRLL